MNSLGESLRMVLSGFGGRQALVMVWHPSVLKVIDNFHLHRPPMVWPSLGPELAKPLEDIINKRRWKRVERISIRIV